MQAISMSLRGDINGGFLGSSGENQGSPQSVAVNMCALTFNTVLPASRALRYLFPSELWAP